MNWNKEIKQRAVELRKYEKTYPEICTVLDEKIPKGTLSYWFRNIQMSDSFYSMKKIAELERLECSRKKSLEVRKNKLTARLKMLKYKNRHLLHVIDRDVAILMMSMLYWAEGRKYPASSGLSFANSDPRMIKLFLTLFRACYEIDESKFRGTVQCRADQDQESLESFWREVSGIQRFYDTRVDPRSRGIPTKKTEYKEF